jgi:hypothetical protein
VRERVGLGLRVLSVLVLVVAAAGCQTQRSGTLVDWFMSAMSDPNCQFEGPMTGSVEMTLDGQTISGEVSGHSKFVGADSAMSMSMALAGQTTMTDTVNLGEWTYERKDQGPWVRSARKSDGPTLDIEAAGGLVDKGLEHHYGRALNRLEIKNPSAISPEDFFGHIDNASDLAGTMVFWAEEDGTPAGLTVEASWKQQVGSTTVEVSMTLDLAFEIRSGVTIDVPEGAAEPSIEAYSGAADLRGKIAAVETMQGRVYGTYKVGDTSKSLNGSVRIVGGNTEIHITAGQADKTIWSEIVADGNRYVSRDDTIWVSRGKKSSPTLPEVLAAAATDSDAGVQAVGGKPLRCIVSPADSLDVASAFGLDMANVSGPGTQFRIWVDTSGDPAGFGGTLVWGAAVDGIPTSHSMEIDVIFEKADDTPIAAPKNPWKWIVDEKAGVAFALPSQFKKASGKDSQAYVDSRAGVVFAYSVGSAGGDSAKYIASVLVKNFGATIETRYKTILDGQTGESMLGHVYSFGGWMEFVPGKGLQGQNVDSFIIAVAVPRGSLVAVFAFAGTAKNKTDKEVLSNEIFETVQFLS